MMTYRPSPSTAFAAYVIVAFLVLPLLTIIPISFTPNRFISLPDGVWSLRHYATLVTSPTWLSAIRQSLLVALASSTLASGLATLFGLGLWYLRPVGSRWLIGFVMLPMALPPIISAFVLYFFVVQAGLFDTYVGTVLAHVAMVVPMAVVPIVVVLAKVDRRLEQAARTLGASVWQTTWLVMLPTIKGGIAAAWFLSFVLSWEEISVTIFVTSFEVVTLPRLIWTGIRDNLDPVIAAVSVLTIAVTVAIVVGRMTFASFREGRAARNQTIVVA